MRKYRVRATGEVIDVIHFFPIDGYCECRNADGTITERPFREDEDLEEYDEPNWERIRYEAAKDILIAMLGAKVQNVDVTTDGETARLNLPQAAVWYADALVYNLKNGLK